MDVLIIFGAVIASAVFLATRRSHVERMARAPLTRIADLRPRAWAKVAGTYRCKGPLLQSPLGDRPCAAYLAAKGEDWWSHAADGVVDDGAGTILVRAADARVITGMVIRGGGQLSADKEDVIADGAWVAVYGFVEATDEYVADGEGAAYRDAPKRTVMEMTGGSKIIITNRPHVAGIVTEERALPGR